MAGFLEKLKLPASHSRADAASQQKNQFRDQDDPRLVYRISSRARRISLRVNAADREVIVTVPGQRALNKAKAFVHKQKDWIDVQLEALPPCQPFHPGASILFQGELYELVKIPGRARPFINMADQTICVSTPGGLDSFPGRVRRLLIREARGALEGATFFYAKQLGREVAKISVRDTASRWGSCISRRGQGYISYSWRLISAPPFVLDYVAAHECAHMIEDNHSRAYWNVVAGIYPDYKKAKHWLKHNGALLHAVGAEY